MDVYFILFIVSSNYASLSAFQLNVTLPKKLLVKALSSAEAPARHPNKNSNNRKIESARDDGKSEKTEMAGASSLCPSHRPPRDFFFPLSSPPYDTKRTLQRREL